MQRAIGRVAVVEVNPDREHLAQHVDGRLHMRNAILHTPGAVAIDIGAFHHRDGEILMAGDEPVGVVGFVEQDGAHGPRVAAKRTGHESDDGRCMRDLVHRRMGEQAALARAALDRELGPKGCELLLIQDSGHQLEAVF